MTKENLDLGFGDLIDTAYLELRDAKPAFEELHFFAWLAWRGFVAGYSIANARGSSPKFARELAMLYGTRRHWSELSNKPQHWSRWPRGVCVFGSYQFQGRSGLHVASRFANTIFTAAKIVKIETFGGIHQEKLKTNDLLQSEKSLAEELKNTTLRLDLWLAGVMRRDFEVLQSRVVEEYWNTVKDYVITVSIVWQCVKELKKANGKGRVAMSTRTVRDWSQNWTKLNRHATRDIPYSWNQVRNWILRHKHVDIGPPGMMDKPVV